MKTNDTVFADRLREYMESHDLSYKDLERITGIPAQTLNRYVLGQRKPKITIIPELAEKLGVSDRWLMGLQESVSPAKQMLLDATKDLSDEQVLKLLNIIEEAKKLF